MLYILKIPTKFGVALQSFCENQNSVHDEDQDHDFSLDFIPDLHFIHRRHPSNFVLIR